MAATLCEVLVSEHGLATAVHSASLQYIDMIRSGSYKVVFEGTKRECTDYAEEHNQSLLQED